MRSLLVLGLVAVCTVLISSESALAVGGGSSKAKIKFKNVCNENQNSYGNYNSYGKQIAIYVEAYGARPPKNLGQLRRKLIYVDPHEHRKTSNLKKGKYCVYAICASHLYGKNSQKIYMHKIKWLDKKYVHIKGYDQYCEVDCEGFRHFQKDD